MAIGLSHIAFHADLSPILQVGADEYLRRFATLVYLYPCGSRQFDAEAEIESLDRIEFDNELQYYDLLDLCTAGIDRAKSVTTAGCYAWVQKWLRAHSGRAGVPPVTPPDGCNDTHID